MGNISEYRLEPVSAAIVDVTEQAWTKQIEDHDADLPRARFLTFVDWARGHIGGQPTAGLGKVYVYTLLTNQRGNEALAMLSISHARPSPQDAWLKVLEVRLEPRLEAMMLEDEPDLAELSDVVAATLVLATQLTIDEFPSKELKVYGDSPATKDFMEGLAGQLAANHDIAVTAHRNWLVIRLKE